MGHRKMATIILTCVKMVPVKPQFRAMYTGRQSVVFVFEALDRIRHFYHKQEFNIIATHKSSTLLS